MFADSWFGNSWLAGAPRSLESPQPKWTAMKHEWKKVRWCFCFRWCHIALPFYALKVVSSAPCWKWFGYTLTDSSGVIFDNVDHGVQRLSSNNCFCGPLAFDFVASNARLDSHKKHEIACWSPLQAVCWIPSKSQQWPRVFHHWSFSIGSRHEALC